MAELENRGQLWWDWWNASGQAHLTRLLREDWNPIGSEDTPADEYASYATRIGGLLHEGASVDQLTMFLSDARTGAMGLQADGDGDRRAASAIHDWYRETRRHHAHP
jgi:hypothetical protein